MIFIHFNSILTWKDLFRKELNLFNFIPIYDHQILILYLKMRKINTKYMLSMFFIAALNNFNWFSRLFQYFLMKNFYMKTCHYCIPQIKLFWCITVLWKSHLENSGDKIFYSMIISFIFLKNSYVVCIK